MIYTNTPIQSLKSIRSCCFCLAFARCTSMKLNVQFKRNFPHLWGNFYSETFSTKNLHFTPINLVFW